MFKRIAGITMCSLVLATVPVAWLVQPKEAEAAMMIWCPNPNNPATNEIWDAAHQNFNQCMEGKCCCFAPACLDGCYDQCLEWATYCQTWSLPNDLDTCNFACEAANHYECG